MVERGRSVVNSSRTSEFFARLGAWQMKQYEHTASDYEPVKPLARAFDEVEAARASRFGADDAEGFASLTDEGVAPGDGLGVEGGGGGGGGGGAGRGGRPPPARGRPGRPGAGGGAGRPRLHLIFAKF